MEKQIIEVFKLLGINESLLTNVQLNEVSNNSGITGIQGDNNNINNTIDSIPVIDNINQQISNLGKTLSDRISDLANNTKQDLCDFKINFENENQKKFTKLEEEIENSKKSIPKWVYWVWLIVIIALGLSVASLFIKVSYNWNVELVSTSIILTFVGILATFIVVGNYMQVRDIKSEIKDRIDALEKDFNGKIKMFSDRFNFELDKKEDTNIVSIEKEFCFWSMNIANNTKYFSDLFIFLDKIKGKNEKIQYSEKAAELLKQKNIILSEHDKDIVKSLADIYYIYLLPQLNDFIQNITIK
jgi:predicted Holliday junction resolvase-like endonuclease